MVPIRSGGVCVADGRPDNNGASISLGPNPSGITLSTSSLCSHGTAAGKGLQGPILLGGVVWNTINNVYLRFYPVTDLLLSTQGPQARRSPCRAHISSGCIWRAGLDPTRVNGWGPCFRYYAHHSRSPVGCSCSRGPYTYFSSAATHFEVKTFLGFAAR